MNSERRQAIGLGLTIPVGLIVSGQEAGLDYEMTAMLTPISGRYVCVALTVSAAMGVSAAGVSGMPVTTETLREFPVARVLTEAVRDREVEARLDELAAAVGDSPDSDTLQVLAAVYRYGHAVSDTPTREVMRRMRLSRSKASRWIAMARAAGHLGQTDERKAGGVSYDPVKKRIWESGRAMVNPPGTRTPEDPGQHTDETAGQEREE